jgi:hypothetical protein
LIAASVAGPTMMMIAKTIEPIVSPAQPPGAAAGSDELRRRQRSALAEYHYRQGK